MRSQLLFTLFIVLAFGWHGLAMGQGVTFSLGAAVGAPEDTVTIPLAVANFTNISGYQGTLRWDTTFLFFLALNSPTPGFNNIVGSPGQGIIPEDAATFAWLDFSGGAKSLADSTVVIEISFVIKSGVSAGVTPVLVDSSVTPLGYSTTGSLLPIVANSGSITISVCAGSSDPGFTFPSAICLNDPDPLPTITGDAGGTFSVNNGAIINPVTGELDLSTTTAGGTYTITYMLGAPCPASSIQIIQILALDDASFIFADSVCANEPNPSATITGLTGGTFSVDQGASIDPATGELFLSSTTVGTIYEVTYTTTGPCPTQSTQSILVQGGADPSFTFPASVCPGAPDPEATILGNSGGTFTISPVANIDPFTGELDLTSVTPGAVYTITYTVGGSCPAATTQQVVVEDNTPPTTVTLPNIVESCSATLTAPTTTDDCAGLITATTTDPLTYTAQGSYTVNWTFDDGNGNSISVPQQVIIDDNTPPTVICKNFTLQLDPGGNGLLLPTDIDNGSFDDCGAVTLSVSKQNFTQADVGTIQVYLIATDANGNSDSCSATVTVPPFGPPLTFNVGSVGGSPEDTVVVPISVEDFTNLSGYQGTFRWDSTAVEYLSASSPASGLVNIFGPPGQGSIPEDALTFTWVDFSGGSQSLTDGTVMMELSFIIKANAPAGVTPLTIDGSVTSLGYSDGYLFLTPAVNQGTLTVTLCSGTADPGFIFPSSACINGANPQASLIGDPGGIYSVDNGAAIDPVTGELDLSSTAAGISYLITYTVGSPCAVFSSQTIQILDEDDAGFTYPDTVCFNGVDPLAIVTGLSGGSFSVDNGASINAATGTLSLASTLPGSTYSVTYTTNGDCPGSETRMIYIRPADDASFTLADTVCADAANPIPVITGLGGGVFSVDQGATVNASTGELILSSTIPGSTYEVTYTTTGPCPSQSTQSILVQAVSDPSFTFPATVCPGAPDPEATILGSSGGTFTIFPSATIDPFTGELDLTSVTQGVVYTVTYTVGTDCPASSSQQTVIEDNTPPAMVTLPPVVASCSATLTPPSTIDDCAGLVFGTTTDPLSYSTQGTFTVTWTFDDGNGNTISVPQQVVINDVEAPAVICQDITVQLDPNGTKSIFPGQVDNGSFDACSAVTLSLSQQTFTQADLGTNLVYLIATDANGNSDSCAAVVTVVDVDAPVAICQPLALALDSTGHAALVPADLDGGSTVFVGQPIFSVSQDSFDCSDMGANHILLFVADSNGYADTCVSLVTLADTLAPMLETRDVTLGLDGFGQLELVTQDVVESAYDACGIQSVTLSQTEFNCFSVGTHEVIVTVRDMAGNVSVDTALVTVEDQIAPTLSTQVPSVTIQLDSAGIGSVAASEFGVLAIDPCGLSALELDQSVFDCSDIGRNEVVIRARDLHGNEGTDTIVVVVEDVISPVAFCQDVVLHLDTNGVAVLTPMMMDAGSNDACGIDSMTVSQDTFTTDDMGANAVILTVFDAGGNTDICAAIVTVEEPTSIGALANQDLTLTVFPNPSHGALNLTWATQEPGEVRVAVVDGMGKIAFSEKWNKTNQTLKASLDLQHLAEGMYLIRVQQGDILRTSRVIRQ